MGQQIQYIAIVLAFLLATGQLAESKRTYSSRSRGSSGSSSSSSNRRTSSHSGSVTKPTYSTNSHADIAKLSYPGYNSQPNRPKASAPVSPPVHNVAPSYAAKPAPSAPAQSAPNIGWNVPPKAQGPPPSYSATNPAGGARTNIHEAPPMYKPNNAAPPSYSAATNSQPFGSGVRPAQNYGTGSATGNYGSGTATGNYGNSGVHHTGSVYRPRNNFTSGGGSHTPISPTYTQGVHSSYPQQHYPASNYQPAGLPPGAHYYPAGGVPHGATIYPAGGVPQGAHYYPSAGGVPPGATFYPAAGGVPPGATFYPMGQIPQGATFYPAASPTIVKGSSGPGLGTGLIAGAIGGAILGHALTPSGSNSRTVHQYPAAPPVSSDGDKDRIIIINNGPPGSVTTSNADGTTVINNGAAAPAAAGAPPAAPAGVAPPPYMQAGSGAVAPPPGAPAAAAPSGAPVAETPAPLAPFAPGTFESLNNPAQATPAAGETPAVAAAAPGENQNAAPTPAPGTEQQPPPGGLICVPIMMNVTDPADSTKMIEVQQIACYPAPPPPAAGDASAAPGAVTPTPSGAPVTEAPAQQQQQTDVNAAIPTQRTSTAELPESSKIQKASSGASSMFGVFTTSMFAFLLAYCIH